MGSILRFIAWVLTQVGKYAKSVIDKVVAWVRANVNTVIKWIERGISFATILQWILSILGLG